MFAAKLFQAFCMRPDHHFNAAVDTTNNVCTRTAAPVFACIKSIGHSRNTFQAVKSTPLNVVIPVMQELRRPDNVIIVALMQVNTDVAHHSVKPVTSALP